MPAEWEARPGTQYFNWGYTDALSMAQWTGGVWNGNIPSQDPSFMSRLHARPGDFALVIPGLLGIEAATLLPSHSPVMPATVDPLGNHTLIATDTIDNHAALEDIRRRLTQ